MTSGRLAYHGPVSVGEPRIVSTRPDGAQGAKKPWKRLLVRPFGDPPMIRAAVAQAERRDEWVRRPRARAASPLFGVARARLARGYVSDGRLGLIQAVDDGPHGKVYPTCDAKAIADALDVIGDRARREAQPTKEAESAVGTPEALPGARVTSTGSKR